MSTRLTRREFLRLSTLFGGAAPLLPLFDRRRRLPGDDDIKLPTLKVVRVGIRQDDIYESPSLEAPIIAHRQRDELVSVLEEFVSDFGPPWNPRWYRVIGGYMHTAHRSMDVSWRAADQGPGALGRDTLFLHRQARAQVHDDVD
jgi:hypothetical protein